MIRRVFRRRSFRRRFLQWLRQPAHVYEYRPPCYVVMATSGDVRFAIASADTPRAIAGALADRIAGFQQRGFDVVPCGSAGVFLHRYSIADNTDSVLRLTIEYLGAPMIAVSGDVALPHSWN